MKLFINKIELAQPKAVISANITLLDLYWDMGNILLHKKKTSEKRRKSKRF